MVDSQTIQSFVDACSRPGCPICNYTLDIVERAVGNLFYESILDPLSRQQLRDSLGLCREHARLVIEAGLSDALGLAIVYEDILDTILHSLPADGGVSNDSRKEIVRQLVASKPCPACVQEEETSRRAIAVLAESLSKKEIGNAFQHSEGLCLPHLRAVLETISNKEAARILLDVQREKSNKLIAELKEFIRKNDYRFHDEPFGSERNSYRRAIEVVTGKFRYKPE